MIHARIENGQIIPLTDADRQKLEAAFLDGKITLNSDNCPQVADAIEKYSAALIEQNRTAYEALARYD